MMRSPGHASTSSLKKLVRFTQCPFQIFKISPDRLDLRPVVLPIPIVKEFLIPAVQGTDAPGVPDRAPVLFGARGNLLLT